MVTRLCLGNFRCLNTFGHRPGRRELIPGSTGSGKSPLLDALLRLRQFVSKGALLDEFLILPQRTRRLEQRQITIELEAELEGAR